MISDLEKTIVITGHYGSGKTNLALNLALALRDGGEEVTLADLDVVNPYFRTADFREIAKLNGISLIASDYANSNLDIPSLSGGLDAKINSGGTLIIDVGGDDAGAYALGRYAPRIRQRPYTMLYVVSAYRYLTREPSEAAELLKQIESASRLSVTHIANCSNLGVETTVKDVLDSIQYAGSVAEITGKPLMFTAIDKRLREELARDEFSRELSSGELFPVDIYVKTPWN